MWSRWLLLVISYLLLDAAVWTSEGFYALLEGRSQTRLPGGKKFRSA